MASVDPENGHLVIHVVYDGAPTSGKTESMRSLGRKLGREVTTPEEDEEGRTLLFDWMDYTGGQIFGRPIQCRVISVPGQRELAERRYTILQSADVVVFVADSVVDAFPASEEQCADLRRRMGSARRAVPIVFQLNKRDLSPVLPASEMKERLGVSPTDVCVETVATDGEGIRSTFVLGVGEALRALKMTGELYRLGSGDIHETQDIQLPSASQLLEILRGNPVT